MKIYGNRLYCAKLFPAPVTLTTALAYTLSNTNDAKQEKFVGSSRHCDNARQVLCSIRAFQLVAKEFSCFGGGTDSGVSANLWVWGSRYPPFPPNHSRREFREKRGNQPNCRSRRVTRCNNVFKDELRRCQIIPSSAPLPLPPSPPCGRHQSAQCWRQDKAGRETMLHEELVLLTAVSVTLTICSCVVMCFCACASCTCVRGDPHGRTFATTARSDLAQSPPPPSSSSPPPPTSSSSTSQLRVPTDASPASTSINMGPVTSCSKIEVEENPLPSYEEVIKALP